MSNENQPKNANAEASLDDLHADLSSKARSPADLEPSNPEWATTKMSDADLAMFAHSDAAEVSLTSGRDIQDPSQDVWETRKVDGNIEHLLAMSNPQCVPEAADSGEDEMSQGATTKMSDYDIRRSIEAAAPLPIDEPVRRAEHITPNQRPSSPPEPSSPRPGAPTPALPDAPTPASSHLPGAQTPANSPLPKVLTAGVLLVVIGLIVWAMMP